MAEYEAQMALLPAACLSALFNAVLYFVLPLLEDDERLEDTIEFFVHDLESSLHLVK